MNKKIMTGMLGATMLAATILPAVTVEAASTSPLSVGSNINTTGLGVLHTKPQKEGTTFQLKIGAKLEQKNNNIIDFKVYENNKLIHSVKPNAQQAQYTKTITKNGVYKIVAIDKKGTTVSKTVYVTHFDSKAPTVTSKVSGSKVTLTIKDDVLLKDIYNATASNKTFFNSKKLTGNSETVVFSSVKKGTYKVTVTDAAGRTTTHSFTVK